MKSWEDADGCNCYYYYWLVADGYAVKNGFKFIDLLALGVLFAASIKAKASKKLLLAGDGDTNGICYYCYWFCC